LNPGQYTSSDYTQTLDDHLVLASIGTIGDAYDNALAESFVDSYKTELISDRVWRSRTQLELATVEWVSWYNHDRLHESLGDIPPAEFEHNYALALSAPSPLEHSAAPNGTKPTARALPPMEMTSYGQPPPAGRPEPRHGLPTGLGQPTDGSRHPGAPHGLPTFPQALRLSSIELNNITTKEPT
jgi:Integrase core domain